MRCNICNDLLDPYEVQLGRDGAWEPCYKCKVASLVDYDRDIAPPLEYEEENEDD